MNQHLQSILHFIEQDKSLSAAEKNALLKSLKDADKEFEITSFKLDRTEKVKRTTAILLEETIEELEQKRKAVEAQNRELEIESSLERVRTVAMGMKKPGDLLDICEILFKELAALSFIELRNTMINIHNDKKNSLLNYDYSGNTDKTVTDIPYTFHPLVEKQVRVTKAAPDAFFDFSFAGEELRSFRELRKNNGEQDDPQLEITDALYYYFYSIGDGSVGISTYSPINDQKLELLKRFRNVFDLAYKRYVDISNAEAQAKEAQIELALERVRARTMAMQKSDELNEVVFELFEQMNPLGFAQWGCAIALADETNEGFNQWLSSPTERKPTGSIHVPKIDHRVFDELLSVYTDQLPQLTIEIQDTENYNWDLLWFEEADFNKTPQPVKDSILASTKVVFSTVSLRYGLMLAIDDNPIPQDMIKILSRFAKVFEQTYTRFLDLQKAEAQARESQIQLALERVRARTMAMQHSDELQDAALVLVNQVKALSVPVFGCGFNIWDNDRKVATAWMAGEDRIQPPFKTSSSEDVFVHIHEAAQKSEALFVREQRGEELKTHYRYMTSIPTFKAVVEKMAEAGIAVPTCQIIHCAFFAQGYLMFITYEAVPEAHHIFKRFASVFEQTYTRFLDLQKAEAQAREAQIELALERVRARTMAMQHSEELKDAASLLFQQVSVLGIHSWTSGFQLWDKDQKAVTVWTCTEGVMVPPFIMPATEETSMIHILEAAKRGEILYVEEMGGEALENHYKYMASLPSTKAAFESIAAEAIELPAFQIFHAAYFSYGFLLFITRKPCPEAYDIFKRFAKVFDQTYTRFLDLQKAEAQAREARIQLAMERVRARTMAMQRSDELADAASLLFKLISDFDLKIWSSAFQIWNADDISSTAWASAPDGSIQAPFRLPYDEDIYFKKIYEARQRGEDFFVIESSGKELEETYHYMFNLPGVKEYFDDAQELGFPIPTYQITHCVFFPNGYLMFITYVPCPEMWDIFKRFAKVFEQTYTRFLDLQKAEAQAKEAQIETALERVRSRTMGMQKSEELKDVIKIVYQQLTHLKINLEHAGFVVDYTPGGDWHFWIADEQDIPSKITHPYFESVWATQFNEAKEKGTDFFATNLNFEEKNKFYNELLSYVPGLPEASKDFYLNCPGLAASTVLFDNVGLYIENFSGTLYTEEENTTLMRFGKVFQQTYTRFLDLQKAEAQAREAQIEAALEKVRSCSLAMHKSDELNEVVSILFAKLKELQIPVIAVGLGIYIDGSKDLNTYVCGENNEGLVINNYRLPYFPHKILNDFNKAREEQLDFFVGNYSKEEKNSFYKYLFEHVAEIRHLPEDIKSMIFESPTYTITMVAVKNATFNINDFEGKTLTEKEIEIIKRFAKVFDQSYTRFLDLQKAEAQAKEAQIEVALERVRARAMAMHTSKELKEVALELRKQMGLLGQKDLEVCAIHLYDADENYFESWSAMRPPGAEGEIFQGQARFPKRGIRIVDELMGHYANGSKDYVLANEEEKIVEWFSVMKAHAPELYDSIMQAVGDAPINKMKAYWSVADFAGGALVMVTYSLPDEQSRNLLRRSSNVFELAYTRFLDLQKAEAQAREATIEAALEKVRSRSLAMHTTSELVDMVTVIVEKLKDLGVILDANGVVLCTYFPDSKDVLHWIASPDLSFAGSYLVPYFDHPFFNDAWQSKESGELYFSKVYSIKDKNSFFEYAFEHSDYKHFPDDFKQWVFQNDQHILSFAWQKNSAILIPSYTGVQPSKDDVAILIRFVKVFEQAYVRFLDLQKAEAQAREAQIETGLERVRSRSLAMHNTSELQEVIHTVHSELLRLNIAIHGGSFIAINSDINTTLRCWGSGGTADTSEEVHLPLYEKPFCTNLLNGIKKGPGFFTESFTQQEKFDFFTFLFKHDPWSKLDAKQKRETLSDMGGYTRSVCVSKHTSIFIINHLGKQFSAADNDILKRFGKVFEQTYTRFLDLQKAEEQAREAMIETVLERVRSRTMAMQKSDELTDVAGLLFEQVSALGIKTWTAGFNVWSDDNNSYVDYITSPKGGFIEPYTVQTEMAEALMDISNARKSGVEFDVQYVEGEKIKQLYLALTRMDEKQFEIMLQDGVRFPSHQYEHFVFGSKVSLMFITYEPVPKAHEIFKRLGKVFEQTYTRFLDLKKAEAQAREATIEASLERVRSKTMTMHNSQDVGDTVAAMFDELLKLGIEKTVRCGIILIEDTKQMEVWNASKDADGKVTLILGHLDMSIHPALSKVYDAWKNKLQEISYEFIDEDLKDYFRAINNSPEYPFQIDIASLPSRSFLSDFFFAEGAIFAYTQGEIDLETTQICKRFAAVFGQTYRRYLDLQRAEAQALEAIKRASVDRVRAEIASMRTTNDLEKITPLVWNELTTLGVPFIRCGVFIIDDEQQQVHTFLSTPGGKAIAAFHLPYNTSEQITQVVIHWRQNKIYKDHWDEAAFDEWTNTLVEKGIIAAQEQYITTIHPTNLHLHFLPFRQGMLYAGSESTFTEEEIQLVQSLADAFSTAYARYEDFNKLEMAKEQIEKTLTDLKLAQTQLVQSAKMVSLGELTAGIAHEIQNPLNFVNNFSEVNTELIDEMKEQLAMGNQQEALEIANDIRENELKINHHGKRADAIVKGMLQHSRTSTATKEPTDINKLADEYLRLAYHGLRAKDKSFNATLKTDYDETLEKINIIPQDIGRVILNLITNAFYSTNEKQKQNNVGYEPTVTVSTKRESDKIQVSVKDNGNGIPQKIVDKIFQPFFTTKPTGQGTGLGLSLAYDIVKAHGGELKVETSEGEETTFIITL